MKKIILPCIISFIILTIANQSLAATATVNATAVRVREKASTGANIVTNLYKEDEVEILEENGEWYKVKYGEKVGYAKAEFLTKKKETVDNTTTQNTVATNEIKPQNTTNTENQTTIEQNVVPNQESINITVQELNIGENITLPNTIKIRLIPNLSTNSKIEMAKGSNVTIEAKLGNWYKISDGTVSGWVTESKLTAEAIPEEQPPVEEPKPAQTEPEVSTPLENTTPTEENEPEPEPEKEQPQETQTSNETTTKKTGIVIVETARIRKSASTSSDIVDVLDEDDIVTILGEEGNFYKISFGKLEGYVSKSLIKEKNVTSRSTTEERTNDETKQEIVQTTSSSTTGNDVIAFAKQYLGYPYVLGCSSPEKGFDCSGFTRYVFGHFDYQLGTVAADQTSLGSVVERANLQTGDLILFYNDAKTKIGHCGIYIGGGDFIHSANPQRGVVIDNLNTNSYYSQRFVTARRIVE